MIFENLYIYYVAELTFYFYSLLKNTSFFLICLGLSSDILNVHHIDPTLNITQYLMPVYII